MFDICFTGEVVTDEDVTQLHLGIITLGRITERIGASCSTWSERDYERQWLEVAKRLLHPDSCSAFITDVTEDLVTWWPAWRIDDLIILQSQLLFVGAKEGDEEYNPQAANFSLEDPYASVRDRDEGHAKECRKTGICRRPKLGLRCSYAEGDLCVSEWCVSMEEMREFLERRTKDWVQ